MAHAEPAVATKAPPRKKKTAVVVIHGIGEQIPMDTLRGFVHTVWTTDRDLFPKNRRDSDTGAARITNPTWSKPDTRNRSFELRRITTERARNGRRCDFYEFYWADLMHGTSWEHVQAWVTSLLMRKPSRVPANLFAAWILLWIVSIVAAIFVAYPTVCTVTDACAAWVLPVLSVVSAIVVGGFVNMYLLHYAGDAARYVSATPVNVGRRQEIREKGVALLESLMGIGPDGWNPDAGTPLPYDRIIVVGHSLGSIIGYDILTHAFARNNRAFHQVKMAEQPARNALEKLVRDACETGSDLDPDAFNAAQDAARAELIAAGSPWIVSDFITLGSPLTHAEVLMAKDVEDLRIQQTERIMPTCPPELERDLTTKRDHFTYWPGRRRDADDDIEAALTRIPHHAAHFGYTRWTNLYSPAKDLFWGDIISGPLAEEFGIPGRAGKIVGGVRDIPVMAAGSDARPPFFTHTKYWNLEDGDEPPPAHIVALRKALGLARDGG